MLPAAVDLVTAGRALGIGRTTAYHLARTGTFPCRIERVGNKYVVPAAELLTFLGLTGPGLSGFDHMDNQPTAAGQPAPQEGR
jgi:predicted DNA-binding transcriptional regulator AlpA